jgi:ABC-2 type transport system ATP-binding protein
MPAIETTTLTRRYGTRRGIEAVNLVVPEGSLFGFLGPNGAGKTTTIRVLLGLLRASEGTALVFGRDCWRESAKIKEELGYLPGDVRLYPWMNGKLGTVGLRKVRRRDLMRRRDAGSQECSAST